MVIMGFMMQFHATAWVEVNMTRVVSQRHQHSQMQRSTQKRHSSIEEIPNICLDCLLKFKKNSRTKVISLEVLLRLRGTGLHLQLIKVRIIM